MFYKQYSFVIGVFLLLLLSACSATKDAGFISKQLVTIDSVPNNAEVYIGGEFIGHSPLAIKLETNISHIITLKKSGFKDEEVSLIPSLKSKKEKYIEFGMMKELGYYYELVPSELTAELEWSELPDTKGIIPFRNMGTLVVKADRLYEVDLISKEEHAIIIEQIISFFNDY